MWYYSSGAITEKGDIRKENQDSILEQRGRVGGSPAALFLVADGMGGLSYGAQVSSYIIRQFARWWESDFPQLIKDGMATEENIRELLEQEIWDINLAVLEFKNRMQCRSGSTLSLLLLYNGRYYIENMGDSRVYLMREDRLYQLTEDQSVAARQMRDQGITQEEADRSRMKHVLTMCLGMFAIPQSNFHCGECARGDQFLVCSDGLHGFVEKRQMEAVLRDERMTADEKANALRNQILPGNARDNVSAIVVEIR